MHFYELDTEDPEAAYMGMARHMAKYFGGSRTEAFAVWADWKAAGGQVIYCNTFRLLGASPAASCPGGRVRAADRRCPSSWWTSPVRT